MTNLLEMTKQEVFWYNNLTKKLHRLHGEVSRLKAVWMKSNSLEDKRKLYKKHREYKQVESKIKEMEG